MSENINETVVVENVTCAKCGGHIFRAGITEKGTYLCMNKINGKFCSRYAFYCKVCDKVYDDEGYGKNGDVYVCKECNTTNWKCTDVKRAIEEYKALIGSVNRDLFSNFNKF